MAHAITIGDVLIASAIAVGIIGIPAAIFFVIWLLNPFRSGH